MSVSLENLPKISVIIAVRNAVSTIADTLDSLALQHYPKLEVIVWDGMSTDRTLEVLARYENLITKLISQPDTGPQDGYNRARAFATGDFIAYLNADDTYEPGMLWAVAEAVLTEPQADVISAGMLHYRIDTSGRKRTIGYYADAGQLALTFENVLSELPTFLLSRFYRGALLEKAGFFSTDRDFCYIANDREWMLRLALIPCHNAVVTHALYGFAVHDKSFSTNPENFIAIVEEHLRLAQSLLARTDLTASQRRVVGRWQGRQLGFGLIKSLMQLRLNAARVYLSRGIKASGWRFVPLTFALFVSRFCHKFGLWLSSGLERG